MDGDLAPLPALFALAERFDAWLIIDDAHGFGVLGAQGRGSLAHFNLPAAPRILLMGTLGKAAGVGGAFVAGSATGHRLSAEQGPQLHFHHRRAAGHRLRLATKPASDPRWRCAAPAIVRQHRPPARWPGRLPWTLLASPTAIQPLIVGDNQAALDLATALWERGLWVPAIRPPTVPKGTARLRISLSAAHTAADIDRLIAALKELA
jgi:8-amino-7-oxononanoate synthase